MSDSHTEALLSARQRYLAALEVQEATFGVLTPPHIAVDLAQTRAEIAQPSTASRAPQRDAQPARPSQHDAPAPPQAAPQIPAAGDVFLGKVVEVDESAVLVEVPSFGADAAVGVIKAENLGGKKFNVGNMARVEVIGVRTLKSGRVIVELKPGTKRENR